MAININAKTSGVGGLETSADNSGNINIQSGGTTVMSVTSSGVAVTGSFSQNGAVYSTQPSFRNLIINGDFLDTAYLMPKSAGFQQWKDRKDGIESYFLPDQAIYPEIFPDSFSKGHCIEKIQIERASLAY